MIVGTRRFSTEVLANYICSNTPAKSSIVKFLEDIPRPDSAAPDDWRLIFVDCLGLDNTAISMMLKTEGTDFLSHDIIALFNLSHNDTSLSDLIDLGVRGFFYDTDQGNIILKGICALKNGELWVARGALMKYVSQKQRTTPQLDETAGLLTRREKEVLLLLASGATNEEISCKLFVSPHTVKTHIYHTLKKLGVQNRLQAALWAAKHLN